MTGTDIFAWGKQDETCTNTARFLNRDGVPTIMQYRPVSPKPPESGPYRTRMVITSARSNDDPTIIEGFSFFDWYTSTWGEQKFRLADAIAQTAKPKRYGVKATQEKEWAPL